MIQEVDQALEALVRRDAVNGARVEVLFDAPTKDWVARRNAPTIDLYLYDIREDLPRRQVVPEAVREAASGVVGEHRMPSRRFRLSYLVTCWTQRPEDEHRLLSACLATFVRSEIIPLDLVAGSLAASPYPVILNVCMPVGQDRSIADVWSAMGGELKPSLDLVAIAPLDAAWSWPAAAPVLEELSLGIASGNGASEQARLHGERGRGGRHGGDLRPEETAVQAELIRGGAIGLRGSVEPTAAAAAAAGGRRGKGGKGSAAATPAPDAADAAADAAAAKGGEPDLSGLGRGRIVRVRGISRP